MASRMIITLGSNHNREYNMHYALRALEGIVHIISRSPIVLTEPIDFVYSTALFANTVLLCESDHSLEEVQASLSGVERACGRTSHSRLEHPELVPMDADLVVWREQVFKPKDFARPYLSEGLISLGLNPTQIRAEGCQSTHIHQHQ